MLRDELREESQVLRRAPTQPDTREWLAETIDAWVAVAVGAAWIVLSVVTAVLEPAPQRSEPLIGVFLSVVFLAIVVTMFAGLGLRRRWGALAAVAASLVGVVATVACPISGHHAFGNWWYGQMACAAALVAVSFWALRSQSVSPTAEPDADVAR
jgi:hypothetical protein